MTANVEVRYCRCGARLARDNSGARCSACVAAARDALLAAPQVPADFWNEVVMREALTSRHMGRVIRAWRTHPYHQRQTFSQDRVASWMRITQAQLSRIENGPPLAHLDRLIQWAQVLRIPAEYLWFALPPTAPENPQEEERVKRSDFLNMTSMVVGGAMLPSTFASVGTSSAEAAQWLAWHMWQRRTDRLDATLVPGDIARRLSSHSHVLTDVDGAYRFTDPAMVDVLVGQRVFHDLASGSSHLLATAQTSHATDLVIGKMAAKNEKVRQSLGQWAYQGPTAVLRVNAAGILAKVGQPAAGDHAIGAIHEDLDSRHLYLTAVTSRVLNVEWSHAGQLVANVGHRPGVLAGRLADGQAARATHQLAAELTNQRDAAARWCSAVLLADLRAQSSDQVHAALGEAIRTETCRENLRSYAAVLAGISPVAT